MEITLNKTFMKAVRKYSEGGVHFRLVDTEKPGVTEDTDVLIHISSIGVCTSDVHVLHGSMEMPDGNIVGHEFSGTIVDLGKGTGNRLKTGDRVVCELAKGACMKCKACRSGHYELCPDKQPPGWKSQGIYTEFTVQPEFCLHKVPDSVSMDVAAMAEPFAICIYGCLERGKISKDDFTVIYGMGSIGLFTLITLLDHGVRNILCVTPTSNGTERLKLARETGATGVLPFGADIEAAVLEMNNGWKADCVIDCSGSADAINQGLGLVRKGGKFIALGIANNDLIPFSFNTAVLNVIEMIFSATSSHDSWIKAMGVLERNGGKIDRVITCRVPLEDWMEAYRKLEQREAIKAVLHT